jgi:hypothetical protein
MSYPIFHDYSAHIELVSSVSRHPKELIKPTLSWGGSHWSRCLAYVSTDCTAIGTGYAAHIKFKYNQTGFARNITFEDITAHNLTRYAIGIDQDGQASAHDPNRRQDDPTLGSNVTINDITFRRITAKDSPNSGMFVCNAGTLACRGIHLESVDFGTNKPCLIQNVFGEGVDVLPPSCIPQTAP